MCTAHGGLQELRLSSLPPFLLVFLLPLDVLLEHDLLLAADCGHHTPTARVNHSGVHRTQLGVLGCVLIGRSSNSSGARLVRVDI